MASKKLDVDLRIEEVTAHSRRNWPVTSGVPMAQGQLKRGDELRLAGRRGGELPLQWEPLVYWPDGSVKWALLDAQPHTRAGQTRYLKLSTGKSKAAPEQRATVSKRGNLVRISTGAIALEIDTNDFRLFNSVRAPDAEGKMVEVLAQGEGLLLVDARGSKCFAHHAPVEATIERRGPIRVTVALKGEYRNRAGRRCFSFTVRLHAFAGCDFVKVEHIILNDNDSGVFTNIREVSVGLKPAGGAEEVEIGDAGKLKGDGRLLQVDHKGWIAEGAGKKKGRRAPGWIAARADDLSVTAVIRDFWQQWPKSLEVRDGQMVLGLFPALAEDQYEGLEPVEKYYYLFDGAKYKIKTGVAKRHEFWLRFAADGSETDTDAFASWVNAPLFAVADPEHFTATGAMGDLTPATEEVSAGYNEAEAKCFQAYTDLVEEEGYYGIFNWGDWFGERVYNWGNEEYDTQHAFFLQLARTGDVRYFHWGETNARHNMDIDVVHYLNDDYRNNWEIGGYQFPLHVGAVYLHAIGHTGGYFPRSVGKKRWPKAYYAADPRNLGHLWNEGTLEYYCLTGDPWALEVGLQIADNLVEIGKVKDFTWWIGRDPHCGRTTGWPLTALSAAYGVSGKQKYARTARKIVELILGNQDSNCGGWIYKLYPGHCFCDTPHWGMATFITAVMMNGMINYYQATGDERVVDSILRGCDFVISDSWDEYAGQFHYTSCPASSLGYDMRILRSLSFAARVGGKERHKQVLLKCFHGWLNYIREMEETGSGYGKSYGSWNRGLPHVIADLKAMEEGVSR